MATTTRHAPRSPRQMTANGKAGAAVSFSATITPVGPGGAWMFIALPAKASAALGQRGRVSVAGTINGHAFRSSVFPDGEGGHHMMVNKEMRAGAKAGAGDKVKVTLTPDRAPRTVAVPAELKRALARAPKARAAWEAYAYSHKKAYADWIDGAKRPETRARRVAQAVEMMSAGRKLN